MVSTRSGKRYRSSGVRTRSAGNARSRATTARPRQRAVEIVVRFGPRKGKKTRKDCLKAGSQLKTQKTSAAGKKLRWCRTNKIA